MTDERPLTLRPYGARALLVEVPDPSGRRALTAWLDSVEHPGIDVVPAECTVLLDVSDLSIDEPKAQQALRQLSRELRALDLAALPPATTSTGTLHTIDVRYDGPDLTAVAELLAMSTDALVRWHTGTAWTVEFLGFMPGFAYLTRADHDEKVERRASPRSAIPSGSVGFAGSYCGIYPRSSPGGWQLVGHTDHVMFDVHGAGATTAPNDRIAFRAVR